MGELLLVRVPCLKEADLWPRSAKVTFLGVSHKVGSCDPADAVANVDVDDEVAVCNGCDDNVRERINPLRLRCTPVVAEDVEGVAGEDEVSLDWATVVNCN